MEKALDGSLYILNELSRDRKVKVEQLPTVACEFFYMLIAEKR